MSFPLGATLFSPQNPAYLNPFTIWLSASNKWQVVQPNGIYAPAGEVLYFFGGGNSPFTVEQPGPGGTSSLTAADFTLGRPAIASFVGMPLYIAFDQQAYAIGDNHQSGTAYVAAGASGLPGTFGTYASITIPAGELFLAASWGMNTPCTQAFICPASFAKRMSWQIQTLGG